jgi:hypothetical protein
MDRAGVGEVLLFDCARWGKNPALGNPEELTRAAEEIRDAIFDEYKIVFADCRLQSCINPLGFDHDHMVTYRNTVSDLLALWSIDFSVSQLNADSVIEQLKSKHAVLEEQIQKMSVQVKGLLHRHTKTVQSHAQTVQSLKEEIVQKDLIIAERDAQLDDRDAQLEKLRRP